MTKCQLFSALKLLVGWLLCAFGQPLWSPWAAMAAGAGAYALFFSVALALPPSKRFLLGTAWFSAVQLVQLAWMVSHPFLYIYAVYLLLSLALGCQWGFLTMLLTEVRILKWRGVLFLAALWTLMEWSRLFLLSGFSWNPLGLALSSHTLSLQVASVVGVYGLTFFVMVVSLLLVRALQTMNQWTWALWLASALFPYMVGGGLLLYHERVSDNSEPPWKVLALQTASPLEETLAFSDIDAYRIHLLNEWRKILALAATKPQADIIVLPEMVVPFGAYALFYPYSQAVKAFNDALGPDALSLLPQPQGIYGEDNYVNNGFWAQGLANALKTPLIIGIEEGRRSAALLFNPGAESPQGSYAKRILVPMGEYIPFSWCRTLAQAYGISGSFIPGDKAIAFDCSARKISPSICYEETFGDLMREGRQCGGELFVNLTNDGWFPGLLLMQQHRDHARLRTVENGLPLLRASNTGITTAIDSFGKTLAELPPDLPGALYVEIPRRSYHTFYTAYGDFPIVALSLFFCLSYLLPGVRRREILIFTS